MGKVLTLLIMILLALASVAGYVLLTGEIRSGEEQMADGQGRLEQGQATLEEGKVELMAGKQKLADGKKEYDQAHDSLFLVLVDKLLNAGKGFKDARKRITKGNQQIAKGEANVEAGEDRVAAGELRLSQGSERLMLAKGVRVACAVAAVCLAVLSVVFGFRWRRSLARIFVHAKT
jgi:uncharacterized phage infection (PIP) family protein YhgE